MKILTNWVNTYVSNIKRTHRHKVAYAIDEYKQFGYNTTDCITHDAEKMVAFALGFPRDTVAKLHRSYSEHHLENSKKKNIKSMFIDIHCSGEKPDKQLSLRDYFSKSKELQELEGFKELAEAKNFGENVSIKELRAEVDRATSSVKEFLKFGIEVLKRIRKK